MAKAKTPAEQRAALIRQVDELDLNRVKELRAIFDRPAVAEAIADIQALADPTDEQAVTRPATADASALIAAVLQPLTQGPLVADQLAGRLDARLNPAPVPPTPSVDPGPAAPVPTA